MMRAALLVVPVLLVVGCGSPSLVLVHDGQADAVIVVADQAPATAHAAADTLRHYLQRMSGTELAVVAPPANQAAARVVMTVDPGRADLGDDGFRIHTEGDALRLTARTGDGLRHAVYTLLETLGCRKYSVEPATVPHLATLTVPPLDLSQVPRFSFRMQDLHDPAYLAWHKLDTNEDFGLFVHTFDDLVPPGRHFAEHPEYFSLINGHRTPAGQLCLSNPEVLDVVVADLRRRMKANPQATFWSVSQNDTYAWCECEHCRALNEAAGSPSGSLLTFVNQVAAEFPEHTISTLAYQDSRRPPRGITPLPNVNIMLCSIECDRSRPLAEHPGSASFVDDVRGWGRLTHNIFLWDYVIQFRNLVSPFPNLRVLQPNLRFFADSGITAVFEQGLPVMHGEFAALRMYLLSKLLWDPDLDLDALLDDFLTGHYGAAAPHLRRYIDTMHDALAASGEGLNIYGYPTASTDGYLSPARLDAYEDLFVQAEAAVVHDPILRRRVHTAHLPVQYARLEQAKVAADGPRGCFVLGVDSGRRVRPETTALLDTFVTRCQAAGIPRLWEHGIAPQEYLAATRDYFQRSTTGHLALDRPVVLDPPASEKYHDGQAAALTDGLSGWGDYRQRWLGCEGTDLSATIELGRLVPVSTVSARFLQDIDSWVFMPLSVTVLVSADGEHFEPVGTVVNHIPDNRWGPIIAPFEVAFASRPVRHVRVVATSLKTCPTWHKGSGRPSWIFTDEIVVH